MKQKPEITVFMPVYNGEKYLRQSIDSILNQTLKNFDFLIIDDGSTDKSADIIRNYHDPRIRFVQNIRNLGLEKTANRGTSLAQTKYIARIDCDDIAMPERLKDEHEFLESHPDHVAVSSDFEVIDEDGNRLFYQPRPTGNEVLRKIITVTNPFAQPSMMFIKKAVEKAGGYKSDFAEDYDLWTRLICVGKMANISKALCQYRINSKGESIGKRKKHLEALSLIADREWQKYGKKGPVGEEDWQKIWPDLRQIQKPRENELRYYSQLHIFFAKGFRKRSQLHRAFQHWLGAIRWNRKSIYAYCYILMFLMPYSWFAGLENGYINRRYYDGKS